MLGKVSLRWCIQELLFREGNIGADFWVTNCNSPSKTAWWLEHCKQKGKRTEITE